MAYLVVLGIGILVGAGAMYYLIRNGYIKTHSA